MGRVRITRLFVLLALAALLAPRAEASRTSVWESNPHASMTATKAEAAGLLAALAPAATADAEPTAPPLFNLGDIVLVERELEHEDRFGLGPLDLLGPTPLRGPPPSHPKTRVRGFELLPPFRVGASPSLSLWGRQACGFSCGEVASDSRYDPWGLESGATFGAIDRRERGVSAVPPSYTAQEKAAATQRALGCLAFGGGAAWTAFSGGALGGVLGGFALMSSGGAACFGKESPIGMVVRETANAAARSQGVEMTPATVRQQEENNAGVEGAVINLMVGFGTLAPGSPMPSGTTGTRSVSPLQEAGGLRRAAMDAHTAAGARTARAVRQSTVAIADVELQDGSRTYYAAGSGSRGLSPAQRELLQNAGVPEDNILTGARYTRGFLKDENHAERIIKRNLPEGAQVIDWGISWAERQKPVPCVKCEPHVSAAGGTLQR
jgi:hypothetical protein